jgi:hypothetical protein
VWRRRSRRESSAGMGDAVAAVRGEGSARAAEWGEGRRGGVGADEGVGVACLLQPPGHYDDATPFCNRRTEAVCC